MQIDILLSKTTFYEFYEISFELTMSGGNEL